MHPAPGRRAFTLIELLVCLVVIAVLAALSFPALQKSQAGARRTACQSNLRQVGIALFGYAGDNNNMLPPIATTYPPPGGQATWGYAIWEYAGGSHAAYRSPQNDLEAMAGAAGANIFRCPETFAKRMASVTVTGNKPSASLYSYGLNCRPVGGGTGKGDGSAYYVLPVPLVRVKAPSLTAMVTEDSFALGSMVGYFTYFGLIPHGGGSNILFYDGHVEWRRLADIPATDGTAAGGIFWNGM